MKLLHSLQLINCIPTRAETSDMSPRKYYVASKMNYSLSPFIQVSLYSGFPPVLSLSTIIWRYIRQFVNIDVKELLANCGKVVCSYMAAYRACFVQCITIHFYTGLARRIHFRCNSPCQSRIGLIMICYRAVYCINTRHKKSKGRLS